MPDVVSPEVRSRMMSGISGKDTKPELVVRRALHAYGFRYRLHDKTLAGRPDLVFPRYKAAVFVDGCFWHAHEGCRYFKIPDTRRAFWIEKLESNAKRDAKNIARLLGDEWRVARVWECALKSGADRTVHDLATWLRANTPAYQEFSASRQFTDSAVE